MVESNFKRVVSIVLSILILCLTASGCSKQEIGTKKEGETKKPVSESTSSVQDFNRSDDSSDSSTGDYEFVEDDEEISTDKTSDDREKRPLASNERERKYVETYEPEFESKSVNWDGPNGYTIIYAKGNTNTLTSAKKLKEFFEKNDNVSLKIASDDTAVGGKEILIGNTNRYTSSLSEQEFAVTLKKGKLTFEGGHFVMVRKAVDWFTTVKRVKGKVATLSGKAKDFVSKLSNGYEYVWGDEFDGEGFPDAGRWDERMFMGYDENFKALDHDLSATCVADGRLKMTAMRYYDPVDEKIQYANGKPLTTSSTMAYMYGYAEIRARVPFVKGAWPAWWTRSTITNVAGDSTPLNPYSTTCIYDVEVDIFEVFSSEDEPLKEVDKITIYGYNTPIKEI